MCDNSWAMTPSSSALSSFRSRPRVTTIAAWSGSRPVAKALGEPSSMTYTLGTGRPAPMHRFSTVRNSSGSPSLVTSRAWEMARATRVEL